MKLEARLLLYFIYEAVFLENSIRQEFWCFFSFPKSQAKCWYCLHICSVQNVLAWVASSSNHTEVTFLLLYNISNEVWLRTWKSIFQLETQETLEKRFAKQKGKWLSRNGAAGPIILELQYYCFGSFQLVFQSCTLLSGGVLGIAMHAQTYS